MARDGSGNYSLPEAAFVANTLIESARMNNNLSDIATALTDSLTANGEKTATADQQMGGYNHTNVATATARGEYARVDELQDGDHVSATPGGTGDVITLTLVPAITAYVAGMRVHFVAGANNTGAVTINVNAVGAVAIERLGNALASGDIVSGDVIDLIYDGTAFQLMSPRRNIQSATFVDLTVTSTATFAGATIADLGSVTTADINGGTIDGVTIGGVSAGAGTFTALTSNGIDDNASAIQLAIANNILQVGQSGSDFNIYRGVQDRFLAIHGGNGIGDGGGILMYGSTASASTAVALRNNGVNVVAVTDDADTTNTILVDVGGAVTFAGAITTGGDILPDTDSTDNLGGASFAWNAIYTDQLVMVPEGSQGLHITDNNLGGVIDFVVNDTTADSAQTGVIIDYNVSGADALTSNRTKIGLRVDSDYTATGGTDTDGQRISHYPLYITNDISGDPYLTYGAYIFQASTHSAGNIAVQYGLTVLNDADNTGTGTVGSLFGADIEARTETTNDVATMYGALIRARALAAASGTNDNMYGLYSAVRVDAGSTLTISGSVRGAYTEVDLDGGSVPSAYGHYVYLDFEAAATISSTSYGLRVNYAAGSTAQVTGTSWGAHIDGEDANYMSNMLLIGSSTSAGTYHLQAIGAGIYSTRSDGGISMHLITNLDNVARFESSDANALIIFEDSTSTADSNRIGVTGDVLRFLAGGEEMLNIDGPNFRMVFGNAGFSPSYEWEFVLPTTQSGDADLRILNQNTGSGDDAILRLQISGTTASNYVMFGDGGDSDVGFIRYNHSTDQMSFTAGAAERTRITASGQQWGTTGASGGAQLWSYVNNSNTLPQFLLEQDGTGDVGIQFALTGVSNWSIGVDNTSDHFLINPSNSISPSGGAFFLFDDGGHFLATGRLETNTGGGATVPAIQVDADGAGGGTGIYGSNTGTNDNVSLAADGLQVAAFQDLGGRPAWYIGSIRAYPALSSGQANDATDFTSTTITSLGTGADSYTVTPQRAGEGDLHFWVTLRVRIAGTGSSPYDIGAEYGIKYYDGTAYQTLTAAQIQRVQIQGNSLGYEDRLDQVVILHGIATASQQRSDNGNWTLRVYHNITAAISTTSSVIENTQWESIELDV